MKVEPVRPIIKGGGFTYQPPVAKKKVEGGGFAEVLKEKIKEIEKETPRPTMKTR